MRSNTVTVQSMPTSAFADVRQEHAEVLAMLYLSRGFDTAQSRRWIFQDRSVDLSMLETAQASGLRSRPGREAPMLEAGEEFAFPPGIESRIKKSLLVRLGLISPLCAAWYYGVPVAAVWKVLEQSGCSMSGYFRARAKLLIDEQFAQTPIRSNGSPVPLGKLLHYRLKASQYFGRTLTADELLHTKLIDPGEGEDARRAFNSHLPWRFRGAFSKEPPPAPGTCSLTPLQESALEQILVVEYQRFRPDRIAFAIGTDWHTVVFYIANLGGSVEEWMTRCGERRQADFIKVLRSLQVPVQKSRLTAVQLLRLHILTGGSEDRLPKLVEAKTFGGLTKKQLAHHLKKVNLPFRKGYRPERSTTDRLSLEAKATTVQYMLNHPGESTRGVIAETIGVNVPTVSSLMALAGIDEKKWDETLRGETQYPPADWPWPLSPVDVLHARALCYSFGFKVEEALRKMFPAKKEAQLRRLAPCVFKAQLVTDVNREDRIVAGWIAFPNAERNFVADYLSKHGYGAPIQGLAHEIGWSRKTLKDFIAGQPALDVVRWGELFHQNNNPDVRLACARRALRRHEKRFAELDSNWATILETHAGDAHKQCTVCGERLPAIPDVFKEFSLHGENLLRGTCKRCKLLGLIRSSESKLLAAAA